jgi:transposase
MLWTRQAVSELVWNKYRIKMSLRVVTNYLSRWGFSCQRPTKRAYGQDSIRVMQFVEKDYPAIAKRAKEEEAEIYWGDEVGISNQENYQRGFAPKGRPPVMKYATKRAKLNMLSAINNQGKVRFMLFSSSMTQQKLIEFMRRMIHDIKRKVFLIVDNLKVHHGKLVKAWLEKHKDRIELFFLPPYAPEYHPDEYLNNALKHDVHSGIKPRTVNEINSRTQSFMRRLQRDSGKVKAFFMHQYVRFAI